VSSSCEIHYGACVPFGCSGWSLGLFLVEKRFLVFMKSSRLDHLPFASKLQWSHLPCALVGTLHVFKIWFHMHCKIKYIWCVMNNVNDLLLHQNWGSDWWDTMNKLAWLKLVHVHYTCLSLHGFIRLNKYKTTNTWTTIQTAAGRTVWLVETPFLDLYLRLSICWILWLLDLLWPWSIKITRKMT